MYNHQDCILEFRSAMEDAGLKFVGELIADGKIHRVHIIGDTEGKENGWYVLHLDGYPAGRFGSWKSGIDEKWKAKQNKSLTAEERKTIEAQIKEQRSKRDEEQQQLYAATAERALNIWNSSPKLEYHEYVANKGITGAGLKTSDDSLVVPVRNAAGQFTSLQFIRPDGVKRFLAGGTIEGCYFTITKPGTKTVETICICEGVATGYSIHAATSLPVAVAFYATNLEPVAKVIRKKYANAKIIICADNDRFTKKPIENPGVYFAIKARDAVKGLDATPLFENPIAEERKLTDFNDLAQLEGLDKVKEQILKCFKPEKPKTLDEKYPTMKKGFYEITERLSAKGNVIGYDEDPQYDELAEYLREEFALVTSKAVNYIYDVDHYRPIEEFELKKRIDELTLESRGPRDVGEFYSSVLYKNSKPTEFFKSADGFINLKNGMLDINTKELIEHDRSKFFKYVLPHHYDEKADCPKWLEFLDFVFEGNQQLVDVSAEVFGYALCGGTPWLHKAFLLDGSGRNGKSTYLEILKALMGKDNYCSIPLRNLDKPFSVVMADGKLANIVGELEARDINSEAFKIAVGGEELTAARKGKDEYQLAFTAKMFFATNNPPVSKDNSEGYYEKLFTIPFRRYIKPEERDASIVDKLRSEIPGILNWALVGLSRLKQRGRLPEIDAVIETLEEYREQNDAIFVWVRQFVSVSHDSQKYMIGAFYEHYQDWCKAEGRYPKSKSWFVRDVVRELKHIVPNMTIEKPGNKTTCIGSFKINASIGPSLSF